MWVKKRRTILRHFTIVRQITYGGRGDTTVVRRWLARAASSLATYERPERIAFTSLLSCSTLALSVHRKTTDRLRCWNNLPVTWNPELLHLRSSLLVRVITITLYFVWLYR